MPINQSLKSQNFDAANIEYFKVFETKPTKQLAIIANTQINLSIMAAQSDQNNLKKKDSSEKDKGSLRGVTTYTQKRICVHIWTKIWLVYITIVMDYCGYVYKTCA